MRSSMIFALIACHGLAACSGGGGDGGGVTEPPNYSISLTLDRSSESTIPGGGFSVTGTLTRAGGYAGTVTFSIEGAPAGIDATVGNPVTSGSATTLSIAVTVGTSVAPGTYPIVARGRGAGVSDATATFTLTVLPTPEFALAVSPGATTLVQGASQSDIQVSIARTNFDGAVTLAVSSSVPAGVSASFSPPSPTGATASMTLQVATSTVPGIYTLTIQGTGAPGVRTATFALTVVAAPDFSLAIQPATVTIDAIPDQRFAGTVTEIGNSPIQTTTIGTTARTATNFKVTVTLEQEIEDARPGFTCTAEITTARKAHVVSVPIQALTVRELLYDARGAVVPKPRPPRPRAGEAWRSCTTSTIARAA